MRFSPTPIRAVISATDMAAVEKVDNQLLPLEFRQPHAALIRRRTRGGDRQGNVGTGGQGGVLSCGGPLEQE